MVINLYSTIEEAASLADVDIAKNNATSYLLNLLKKGPQNYINGFDSEFKLLVINCKIIPVVINHGHDNSSYLSALSVHYVKHGIDSVKDKVKNPVKYGALKFFGILLNKLLNLAKINKAVYVNCWMMPTGVTNSLNEMELSAIRCFFRDTYPSYALIFKGVNNYLHLEGMAIPQANSLINRIVYLAGMDEVFLDKTNIKKALSVNKKTKYKLYQSDELQAEDLPAIMQLYNRLYFGQHSKYSLSYNLKWFKMLREQPLFKLQAFKSQEQELVSFTVTFLDNNSSISSLGACKKDSKEYFHLYTLNFAIRLIDAIGKVKYINMSSGGDEFKKNRGGIAKAEYDLIYFDHLPLFKRAVWQVFISVCKKTIKYLNK